MTPSKPTDSRPWCVRKSHLFKNPIRETETLHRRLAMVWALAATGEDQVKNRLKFLCMAMALTCPWLLPAKVGAVSMQLTFAPFTGDSASATLELTDDGGFITGVITVQPNPNIGDLRAVFLQVIDESILCDLEITGPHVTDIEIDEDNVTSVGNANVNGGGSPGPFDIGIAFGSPGIGSDDIQTTTFFLEHCEMDLTLDMFDLQGWAVRMTSVGTPGSSREGSSKLSVVDIRLTGLEPPNVPTPSGEPGSPSNSAIAPIPEPTTAMFTIVTAAMGAAWWRRRKANV